MQANDSAFYYACYHAFNKKQKRKQKAKKDYGDKCHVKTAKTRFPKAPVTCNGRRILQGAYCV